MTSQNLQEKFTQTLVTGDFAPVIEGLKAQCEIETVHPSVIHYLEQLRTANVPDRPFYLTQWSELGSHILTYRRLFSLRQVEGYFPAILIAGSFMSIEFFMMLETGAVVVMHSDVPAEIAVDLYQGDLSRFNQSLYQQYSLFNIDTFLAIKRAFAPVHDRDLSQLDPQSFFTQLAGALGWNLSQLYQNRYHSVFDWMQDIVEEHGDLLKTMASTNE